jgi:predicted amidophosphoribosyltransferase
VRGAVVYDAVARRFLLRAKLGRHPELLRPLGDQLSAVVVGTRLHVGCTVRSALAVRAFARLGSKRLGARGRRAAAGALRVRTPLPGHRVLLIDDVLTTGATAGACARGLKLTGSHEIRVAVWARTLRGTPQSSGEV